MCARILHWLYSVCNFFYKFFPEYKGEFLTIGAFFLFITQKYFLVFVMWNGRLNPPSFDDSYFYIGSLYKILYFQSFNPSIIHDFSAISYFSYNAFLSYLSLLSGFDSLIIFEYVFYIGSFILPFVIFIFLRSLFQNNFFPNYQSSHLLFIFLFISFFYGQVTYHGFFWVVPSFFMFLLFLSIIVVYQNYNYTLLFPLVFVFLLSHPLAIYTLLFSVFYYFFLFIIDRHSSFIFILRELTFLLFSFFCVEVVIKLIFYLRGITIHGYGSLIYIYNLILGFFDQISFDRFEGSAVSQNEPTVSIHPDVNSVHGFDLIFSEYIHAIYERPVFLFFVLFGLFFVLYKKWYKFAAFFLSLFTVPIIASFFTIYGYRFLYFTWFFTFILVALSFCFLYDILSLFLTFFQKKLLVIISVISLLILFNFFNYKLASTANTQMDYVLDVQCIQDFSLNQDQIYNVDKYSGSIASFLRFWKDDKIKPYSDLIGKDFSNTVLIMSDFSLKNIQSILYNDSVVITKIKDCGVISFYRVE